jgi:protein tyrosine phosphatase (PTP) superfamily phosphohydrolase (DUF442 family)
VTSRAGTAVEAAQARLDAAREKLGSDGMNTLSYAEMERRGWTPKQVRAYERLVDEEQRAVRAFNRALEAAVR